MKPKMHWVIQTNMFSDDGFNRLLSALTRLGSKFTLVKVIEVNNLNAAGFYAGDMQKLVAAIEGLV